MDLNGLLDWVPFLLATGSTIGAAARGRMSWAMVAGAIMAGGLALLVLVPDRAAGITLVPWVVLLAIPSLLGRLLAVAASKQSFSQARWFSLAIAVLHPTGEWVAQATLFRGLALMRRGRWDLAEPKLRAVAENPRYPLSRLSALTYLCRWSGDWRSLADDSGPPEGEPSRTALRVRALGETGCLAEMLTQFEEGQRKYGDLPLWRPAMLSVLAFGGRADAVAAYCRTIMTRLPAQTVASWTAIARLAAGGTEAAAGRVEMGHLARSTEPDISRPAARRLLAPPADASRMPDAWQAALRRAEDARVTPRPQGRVQARWVPVTVALIALNIAVFVVEESSGGSQNVATLYRLGGVWPPGVIQGGQWWRLVTALFLHAGPLHLGLNLGALLLLGGIAERMFGSARFLMIYAVTGVGSMAGVVALMAFGWTATDVLVGASGALMGVAGALFAVAVARFLATRSAALGRWVVAAVLLVLLQSGIDLTTPRISFAGHAIGLSLGVLIGGLPWVRHALVLPGRLRAAAAAEAVLTRRDFAIFSYVAAMIGVALWVRVRQRPAPPNRAAGRRHSIIP